MNTLATIALAIAYTPYIARVLRSAALRERARDYIAALTGFMERLGGAASAEAHEDNEWNEKPQTEEEAEAILSGKGTESA